MHAIIVKTGFSKTGASKPCFEVTFNVSCSVFKENTEHISIKNWTDFGFVDDTSFVIAHKQPFLELTD